MSKKKDPEQEGEIVDQDKVDPAPEDKPAEDPPKDDAPKETPADDADKDAGEEPDEEPVEDEPPKKEGDSDPEPDEEPVEEDQPKEPPADKPTAPGREAQLQAELLEARCQLAAHAAGVDPAKIADAVTLATADAQKEGDATETGVTKAMAGVLKRHPEWKASGDASKKPGSGGFKLGADRDKAGENKKPAGKNSGNAKRWNRFK